MTVVPVSVQAINESDNAVKLARYAQIVGMPECLVWGVNNPSDDPAACQKLWSHEQRVYIARYLGEAQVEIEQRVGYPLSPKYFTSEQQPYTCTRIQTNWTRVLAAGARAVADISLGEVVDHTTDPAVIIVNGVGLLNPDEVHVYHPGTDAEIVPSSIDVTGGMLTIEIPRCRLVLAALEDTPSDGLDYSLVGTCLSSTPVPGNFECEVDIKHVYTDPTLQGVLVYPHGKVCSCSHTCFEDTDTACVYVRSGEFGLMDVEHSSLVGSTWAAVTCRCGRKPTYVRINYLAGLLTLSAQAEDAIVRLAHSKMPIAPCGCDSINALWARDRNVPLVLDSERLNCPFGLNDGAWIAFQFAGAMIKRRMSVL